MESEKILVGDDHIDYAKENFPHIPGFEAQFRDKPEEVVSEAKKGVFSIIVTDLDYTPNGAEGYNILESIKSVKSRKILWTGRANEPEVRQRASQLEVELLDKPEIGTLVGQAIIKAPLKKGGKVLLYVPEGPIYHAFKGIVKSFGKQDLVTVSYKLKEELETNQYGLVIDTSPVISSSNSIHGTVAHDMKYMKLPEVPRVVGIKSGETILAPIINAITRFSESREEKCPQ